MMLISELIEDLKQPTVSDDGRLALDAILRLIGSEMRICAWGSCLRPFALKRNDQLYCCEHCKDWDWNKRRSHGL